MSSLSDSWEYREARAQREREAEKRKAEEERRTAEARRLNDEARAAIDRRNEEARKEKQAEATAALEAELAPDKVRLRNEWIAANPEHRTDALFEQKAWPLLRENLIAQQHEALIEKTQQKLRASGLYEAL